jgi:rhamnosyltransferase
VANNSALPSVAVLLAAYNGKSWISEQIETILSQIDVLVDLYISVDLSSDGTYEFVASLNYSANRVHLLDYGETYGSAGANFLRLIRDVNLEVYDYVAFSDQDDIWLDRKLIYAIEKIELTGAKGYSSNVIAYWNETETLLIDKSYKQKEFDFLFESAGPGCTYVTKADCILRFKAFLSRDSSENVGVELHDWLIYAYFRSNKLKWHIDSTPLMLYRQHDKNQFGANTGLRSFIRRFRQIRSGWYRSEVEKIAIALGYQVPDRLFIMRNMFQTRRRARDALLLFILALLFIY